MLISEKVAYLRGLFDGLDFDATKKEGKILNGILDVLGEIADEISELQNDVDEMNDALISSFDDVDCCDDSDDECGCGCHDHSDEHEHEMLFELVCPTCNEEICFNSEVLNQGSMKCHKCGEDLEFDLSNLEDLTLEDDFCE